MGSETTEHQSFLRVEEGSLSRTLWTRLRSSRICQDERQRCQEGHVWPRPYTYKYTNLHTVTANSDRSFITRATALLNSVFVLRNEDNPSSSSFSQADTRKFKCSLLMMQVKNIDRGQVWAFPSIRPVLFCFLAVLDPRVGHTMDVLSPFISVLRLTLPWAVRSMS